MVEFPDQFFTGKIANIDSSESQVLLIYVFHLIACNGLLDLHRLSLKSEPLICLTLRKMPTSLFLRTRTGSTDTYWRLAFGKMIHTFHGYYPSFSVCSSLVTAEWYWKI